MTASMRAVVYHAPKDVRVETVPLPPCGDGEIRVRVDACAVCGTDYKTFHHGNPRIKPPMVMGHEFTGLVETVGARAGGFEVGDRVVMATSISCGKCFYCRRGWKNLCADLAPMGFSYAGGMAEFVTIPERALANGHVVKVPAGVRAEHAALAEPLSCTVNACENSGVQPGDAVVVVGAGPMGIMNAVMAREFGATKIMMVEINERRLAMCESFGFDRLINPNAEDVVAAVKGQTGGIGADVAIVAAPAAQPQEQAPALVRKRGTVCLFASLPAGKSTIAVDSRPVHYGELRIVGTSDSTPAHVERAVGLIAAGSLPAERLVTHTFGLDGIFRAYEVMESGEALRVVLKP